VFVGVGNTPVVLFLEFVLDCVRSGIAALPEGFDELITLFVVGEQLEGFLLFVGNEPTHVFVKPFLVRLAQLNLQRLGVLLSLLFREWALERIGFLRRFFRGSFFLDGRRRRGCRCRRRLRCSRIGSIRFPILSGGKRRRTQNQRR